MTSIKYLLMLISFCLVYLSYGYFFKTYFYIYLNVLNLFEMINWTSFISFITMLATVVLAICAVLALSSWKKEFSFKEKIKIIKEIKVLSVSLYNKINKSRSPTPFLNLHYNSVSDIRRKYDDFKELDDLDIMRVSCLLDNRFLVNDLEILIDRFSCEIFDQNFERNLYDFLEKYYELFNKFERLRSFKNTKGVFEDIYNKRYIDSKSVEEEIKDCLNFIVIKYEDDEFEKELKELLDKIKNYNIK